MASGGVALSEAGNGTSPFGAPLRALERLWRTIATGVCFAVFGIGQLFMAVTFFPLLVLLVRNRRQRERLGRRVVRVAFAAFVLLMRLTGALRYRVSGLEKLREPGKLIVANHPSLIDVVFLLSFVPDINCVVKPALFKNPFTRYAVMAAGYIPSERDASQVIEACRASLEAGGSLLVFPEGTRTEPGEPLRFQRGAANLAIRLGCDLVPVIIRASEHNLGKGSRWWRVPRRPVSFDFEVKDHLSISPWLRLGYEPAISARELTVSLTNYFRREIETPCLSWPKS